MKTDIEIKDDVYMLLKDSPIMSQVGGTLSKTKKPDKIANEDVVISILANETGQRQEAIVNVNLYVSDQKVGQHYEESTKRLRVLSRVCADFLECNHKDYRLTLDAQRIVEVASLNMHMINNRLLYQIINE